MPFQFLKNTLWILQCEVALWTTQIVAFVEPAVTLVGALLFVPTGEVAIPVVLRVAIFIPQDAGGVRIMDDVLTKEEVVLNQVPDDSAEKCDVAACANGYPDICKGARP